MTFHIKIDCFFFLIWPFRCHNATEKKRVFDWLTQQNWTVVFFCFFDRAANWNLSEPLWTGRMKLVAKGVNVNLKLEDKNTGVLYANCPVETYPGTIFPQHLLCFYAKNLKVDDEWHDTMKCYVPAHCNSPYNHMI